MAWLGVSDSESGSNDTRYIPGIWLRPFIWNPQIIFSLYTPGMYQVYIYLSRGYARNIPSISVQKKWWTWHHDSELASTDHYQCWPGWHDIIPQNEFLLSINIWQVYTRHIPSIFISYLCCRHFAGLPQARLDVSDLDFLRILSILATESAPNLGWGLPKYYTWSFKFHSLAYPKPCANSRNPSFVSAIAIF